MENLTLTELVALLENEESTILKALIQDEIDRRTQTITISFEEYRQLRDMAEEYEKMLINYNQLYNEYSSFIDLFKEEECEVEEKRPIGFRM